MRDRRKPARSMRGERPALRVLADGQTTVSWLLGRLALMCRQDGLDDAARAAVAQRLRDELAVHLQVEEELVYPRLRNVVNDASVIDTVEVEHECLRELMQRVSDVSPSHPLFEARVKVLAEVFDVHLKREVQQLYPLMARLAEDARDLGRRMSERHDELLAAHGREH